VTQEGRFLKAITAEGKDVSNQIDRSLRRAAAEKGVQLVLDNVTNEWAFANSVMQAQVDTPVELVAANSEHDVMKTFIHASAGLKPEQLIMSDLKWKYLVRSAMRGKNIMMTGPAGTGKTMAAKYLVSALERPDFYFNLGATQDPRATLIGNTHFSKEDGTYFAE
jgi:Cdc6-like AAA superfamily ATPase